MFLRVLLVSGARPICFPANFVHSSLCEPEGDEIGPLSKARPCSFLRLPWTQKSHQNSLKLQNQRDWLENKAPSPKYIHDAAKDH